jgi:hypothetical protein
MAIRIRFEYPPGYSMHHYCDNWISRDHHLPEQKIVTLEPGPEQKIVTLEPGGFSVEKSVRMYINVGIIMRHRIK